MEIQPTFINTAVIIIAGVFGWVIRTLWTATAELKKDLALLKEDLPMKFVLKDDYRDDIHEIKEMLKTLTQEIRNTADKIIR